MVFFLKKTRRENIRVIVLIEKYKNFLNTQYPWELWDGDGGNILHGRDWGWGKIGGGGAVSREASTVHSLRR